MKNNTPTPRTPISKLNSNGQRYRVLIDGMYFWSDRVPQYLKAKKYKAISDAELARCIKEYRSAIVNDSKDTDQINAIIERGKKARYWKNVWDKKYEHAVEYCRWHKA